MSKMKTITLYDPNTGALGAIITAPEEELRSTILSTAYITGSHDARKFKVNLETKRLEEITEEPKPTITELRNRRNSLLEGYRWTIMPDSPLANKDEWLVYLQALQVLLKDVTPETTDQIVWPTQPAFVYA